MPLSKLNLNSENYLTDKSKNLIKYTHNDIHNIYGFLTVSIVKNVSRTFRDKITHSIKFSGAIHKVIEFCSILITVAYSALEKTNVFHNILKMWPQCGNIVEKLWNTSSTIFSLFHTSATMWKTNSVWN